MPAPLEPAAPGGRDATTDRGAAPVEVEVEVKAATAGCHHSAIELADPSVEAQVIARLEADPLTEVRKGIGQREGCGPSRSQ